MSPKGSPSARTARTGEAAPREGEAPSFEVALARLEEIVNQLERGEITLDDSLAAFKEGSGLVRLCLERLDAAEAAVQQLMEGGAGTTLAPFEGGEGAARGEQGGVDD